LYLAIEIKVAPSVVLFSAFSIRSCVVLSFFPAFLRATFSSLLFSAKTSAFTLTFAVIDSAGEVPLVLPCFTLLKKSATPL